ncbi:hypothetical protein SLEP1_g54639 [Rubroshorea leprosula]|uniref:LUC7 related protein n=1 Tax=Rubroshorea leprosula TaxID=152421 RepID=A0AAV5MF62_9ROSI|nr:hypothetical protein SLEP1_g54639 [Rubroshorea leprosula]
MSKGPLLQLRRVSLYYSQCWIGAFLVVALLRYEEAKAKGIDNYDKELEDAIDRLIVECDRKIGRALKRLEDEDAKVAIAISVSEVTQIPKVLELSKQIEEKLKEADQYDLEGKADLKIQALEEVEELKTKRADKQSTLLLDAFNKDQASLPQPLPNPPSLAPLPVPAPDPRTQEMINEKLKKTEDLGEKGMVDEAQKALEETEALRKLSAKWDPVLDSPKYTAVDVRITDQKLHVCDICGAFLSVYDSDRRLADHFGGKLHLDYMQIRDKLAELQEERNKSCKLDRGVLCYPFYWWCINQKKEAEIMRENQVGTKTKGIPMTEGGIMIVEAEIVTGIKSTLGLMILEVATGHVQGLGNAPGITIATGVTDTRCMNAAKKKMNTKLFLLR